MENIIERMQHLNSVFRYSSENIIPLQEFCNQLAEILNSNIYLFYEDGNIFCHAIAPEFVCPYNDLSLEGHTLPDTFHSFFNKKDRSTFNVHEKCPICTYENVGICTMGERYYSMIPITSSRKKRAGLLLIRYGGPFEQDEEILCEYAAMVISLDILYRDQEKLKSESLETAYSELAVKTLSLSELYAANAVLKMIDGNWGMVKLADAANVAFVTQSAVTSAIRKLEGAGVISTKTRGVKGKEIFINNKYLRNEITTSLENAVSKG